MAMTHHRPLGRMDDSPSRLLMRFGGEPIVGVTSNDGTALEWLTEVLDLDCVESTAEARWEICARFGPDRYWRALAGRPMGTIHTRPCFAFDTKVMELPSWETENGIALDDSDRSAVLTVRPGHVDVAGDSSTVGWRYTLLMIVSEIIATHARAHQLDLHAASNVSGHKGYVLVGPKGAGKSTVSLHLASTGGARLMSNDRTFLEPEAGGVVIARGLPTGLRLRPETVRGLPALHVNQPWTELLPTYRRAELHAFDRSWPDGTELLLSPAQVADRLGVGRAAEAPVQALLFPELDPCLEGVCATRMDASEVEWSLAQNLFGRSLGNRAATVFEFGSPVLTPRDVTAKVAIAVDAYRVRLGSAAYGPDFAQRLFDQLAAA